MSESIGSLCSESSGFQCKTAIIDDSGTVFVCADDTTVKYSILLCGGSRGHVQVSDEQYFISCCSTDVNPLPSPPPPMPSPQDSDSLFVSDTFLYVSGGTLVTALVFATAYIMTPERAKGLRVIVDLVRALWGK